MEKIYYNIVKILQKPGPLIKHNDEYLLLVGRVFKEAFGNYPNHLRQEILNTPPGKNGGFAGNYVHVYWMGDYVYIGDIYDDRNPDERAKISKEKLFKLIDEWNELIKTKPDNIILYRNDDYNLWFETELPDFDKVEYPGKEDKYKL